jgi:hypothetical protein
MSKIMRIKYEFVESAPETLQPGTMYVSTRYRAIVHLCLCGCGEKVLLNLDPTAWRFTFDGRSLSIWASVGNVGIPCRSHYMVESSQVRWLPPLVDVDPGLALGTAPAPERKKHAKAGRLSQWLSRRIRRS